MKSPNSVALLAIGTELTRGEIANTNGAWLAERLTTLGMDIRCLETVADQKEDIIASLRRCSARCAWVIVTGGLGPTTDDMTSATVAQFLGVSQVRDQRVIELLRKRIADLKLDPAMLDANASQADFPKGAALLDNHHGTAPGFSVEHQGSTIACMPGVPREMKPMFEASLVPTIRGQVQGSESVERLRCFNAPESTLNDQLQGLESEFGVTIGYRAHYPEVQIKILARSANAKDVAERVARATSEARRRLGTALYTEQDVDMPEAVAQLLRSKRLTLSLAESCTGGLVSSLLSARPASDYFLGGVVSYSNQIKIDLLDVSPQLLDTQGAVSEAVAREMAQGIRRKTGSDFSLALTGIAGPTGATETKPLGRVHLAVDSAHGTVSEELNVRNRDRTRVQLYAAWAGLNLVRRRLLEN